MEAVKRPLVSVLMPVYNTAEFLAESLGSILTQDYTQLEVIIVDDGSTDQSMDIVQSFHDPRIVIIKNVENMGLAASLNRAIVISKGFFLARMDADDIAHPSRISRQVNFMLNNPDVDVLGSSMQYFGESRFLNHFPETHDACKSYLMLNVCFGHPLVMFRRHVFDSSENFYNPHLQQYSEEYDLWCRLVDKYRFHNLQEVLLYYRTYSPALKSDSENKRIKNSSRIRKNYLTSCLGNINEDDWNTHCMAALLTGLNFTPDIQKIDLWFRRVLDWNIQTRSFNQEILKEQLAERFFEVCYTYTGIRRWTVISFYKSYWSTKFKPSFIVTLKFLTKQLLKP
ncbi:MAG: glycosyltransferase [Cyclobacteriaceae bacterium]|nr:MAG: glycosyltransferase [Cyclobacteriaceae bacterium]